MHTVTAEVVPSAEIPPLWDLFEQCFRPLRTLAAARHDLTLPEFVDVMTDKRVVKHLTLTDDEEPQVAALATLSNELETNHYISPEFYAGKWPDAYAEGRIWVVGFVAVHPAFRRSAAFADVVASMMENASQMGGVIALDVCRFNDETTHLPETLGQVGRTKVAGGGIEPQLLDVQSYWAWEFPTPA